MAGESATFNVDITLGTIKGELPTDTEVEQLIWDQMEGDLEPDTELATLDVTLNKRYVEGEDLMVSYNDVRESLELILKPYVDPGVRLMLISNVLESLDDAVLNNAT